MCRAPSSVTLSEFSAVTEEEVAHLFKWLPPKTSPLDCLPVSLLKATVHVMAPLLAQLVNLSFAAGVFPSRYKLYKHPSTKKPSMSRNDPASYRPITNLCTFSKVLEKLVLARLRPHVVSTGNLSCLQSAYRPGYLMESALLKEVGDIGRAAGRGLHSSTGS